MDYAHYLNAEAHALPLDDLALGRHSLVVERHLVALPGVQHLGRVDHLCKIWKKKQADEIRVPIAQR